MYCMLIAELLRFEVVQIAIANANNTGHGLSTPGYYEALARGDCTT